MREIIYECSEKFRDSSLSTRLLFPKIVMGSTQLKFIDTVTVAGWLKEIQYIKTNQMMKLVNEIKTIKQAIITVS